jgi:hypothetical protein
MSVEMRWEQCCESQDCTKPAHHGVLCAACFLAATPARRAVEAGEPDADRMPLRPEGNLSHQGAAWLKQLWAA